MQIIPVRNNQCLIDLAMQHAGSAEAAFAMCVQYDLPLSFDLIAGTQFPAPIVENGDVVTLYRTEKSIPCSTITPMSTSRLEGIDYWAIEDDFIVN